MTSKQTFFRHDPELEASGLVRPEELARDYAGLRHLLLFWQVKSRLVGPELKNTSAETLAFFDRYGANHSTFPTEEQSRVRNRSQNTGCLRGKNRVLRFFPRFFGKDTIRIAES